MKIYTIFLIILTFLSYTDKGIYHYFGLFDVLISLIGLIGLWGYVFKKEWLSPSFWKFFFGFNLVWMIGSLYYMSEEFLPKEDPLLMYFTFAIALIILLLHIPYIYALFQYAYRRN